MDLLEFSRVERRGVADGAPTVQLILDRVSTPVLSVVVPVFNEEACIASFIERARGELAQLVPSWEIIVVDDGSEDGTREIVESCVAADSRIRLIAAPRCGKGAAVRRGMLAARGDWRFMADADLSMPPDNLRRFLSAIDATPAPDIVIGSREAAGARRIDEPWTRHAIGRVFNWIVQALVLPGVHDTQCGYKLFSAKAANALFARSTVGGFAFDVELLFLARCSGLTIREVGIVWHCRRDSRVTVGRGAAAFADIVRIRWRGGSTSRAWAYVLAAIFAAAIASDLLRMPLQVSDSLGEILDAQASPSAWESFKYSFGGGAYLRPLRIAQIKLLFDAAQGHYWAAYRGFHAALLVAGVLLFVRALRVRTPTDVASAAFALVVLTGIHTFRGFVQEIFPVNHFLEIAVFALLALNLAQTRGGFWVDAAAALSFVCASLTLDSGLLVWVVAVAAFLSGFRGISARGVAVMTVLLGGYLWLRFVWLAAGTPGLDQRSSGYLLEALDPPELQRRFGDNPLTFYGYNVMASFGSVVASEPRNGVFVTTRAWLAGRLGPPFVLPLTTSLVTSVLIAWAAIQRIRSRSGFDDPSRLIFVFGAVLAASAVLSFAYTKDEIMSTAGAFYALAAFAAVRHAIEWSTLARRAGAVAIAVVLLVVSSGWAIRSAGIHHLLWSQAFKHRNDWARLPGRWAREGRWPENPAAQRLVLTLRAEAIAMPIVNPWFAPRWADAIWDE